MGGPTLGLSFAVEVDTTRDLAFDQTRADALVTVTARGTEGAAPRARAEILIMDRSLSMAGKMKIDEAKRAARAAIDALRDGTHLAIIAGNHETEVVYPIGGGLAVVDPGAKAVAKRQVDSLRAEGGTAIGRWLTLAGELFVSVPTAGIVRHAVLYTDGKNEHESSEQLGSVLRSCTDEFVCDARGLGDDWDYAELQRITDMLHGTAEAVLKISDLTEDFVRLMGQAQRLVVPRAYLSLRLDDRFRVDFVRQSRPVEVDLTGLQQPHGGEVRVPLGPWAPQTRQYHLSLHFEPDSLPVSKELCAARIELYAETPAGPHELCADAAMIVSRHATPGIKLPKPAGLTRVEDMMELGKAMRACVDAYNTGDTARADRDLRRAMELAFHLKDDARLRRLEGVATFDENGLAHLRYDVTPGEMQKLGLDSTKTDVPGEAVARTCDQCGATTYARNVRYCEDCGHPFEGEGGRLS